ncbi:SagB/ThcOx family dehydrogenase [Streptomyces armeniacus]|uniref:SagB/ThcOx family dehydrogenase n=1 Tax=Streptomyces armeniacus TaxID=83291 RepID=A0A345XYH3_9ACTN|nr:SagB/ThcOx family dehydrogenase [Streptomyces armeniacus]AXK36689.1 SagB/ThcOx family dehydrogenase [Streptomyces armeniacus]
MLAQPDGSPVSDPRAYAPLAAELHENSKFSRDRQANFAEPVQRFETDLDRLRGGGDRFGKASAVVLDDEPLPLAPLGELAARRRSHHGTWGDTPLTRRSLATILRVGVGTTGMHRPAPSAGGRYPVECFVAVTDVDGLDPGIYYYAPHALELRRIDPDDPAAALRKSCMQPEDLEGAGAVVVLTGVFSRSTSKYAERGYRFTLLEAGHIGQGICLSAEGVSAGSLCLSGFYDHELDGLLRLDERVESVVHSIVLGAAGERPAGS